MHGIHGIKIHNIGLTFVRRKCPLCLEEEDAKHILLECKKTKYWREKLIHDKWLSMNKDIAYRKILKTTNRTHIQNVGKYLKINGLIK
jgi:hypothetical protein